MDGSVMMSFGGKQGWLAIRDTAPEAVLATLGLRDLGEVPWREGLDLAYLTDDRLVLTPPLPGAVGAEWTLAVGRWLLRPDAPVDVVDLSARLRTEVQLFATHRVTELHRWQRADRGQLLRAFGYVGQLVTAWHGEPDDAEQAAGLPRKLDEDPDVLVSEHDVMRVASAWSVDPTRLDGRPSPGPLRAAAAPDR
jgi:hypothetical protein